MPVAREKRERVLYTAKSGTLDEESRIVLLG